MANRDLSAEYRIDDRSMALERARHLEQRRQAGGLLHGQRGIGRADSTLLGLSASASRRDGGRRQRMVAADRWRSEVLLEEQSLSDERVHGRKRCVAPAMGD